jgi:hypothetical protein
MTAAATSGPARAPRPTSSTPATRMKPASVSRLSMSPTASEFISVPDTNASPPALDR